MIPNMDGGAKSFALGGAFAIALELGVHTLVHYTVPGATLAANLAQSLAPIMDGLGLTTIFGSAAGEAVAGEVATSMTEDVVASATDECVTGGYCPIHNPIVGEPLIETAPVSSPAVTGPSVSPPSVPHDLQALPVLE